jgi:hypothetical protein
LNQVLSAAGRWMLHSGIQRPGGGFARYYRSDENRYLPVSTEISGYALSTLLYLFQRTGQEEFRAAALQVGEFLLRDGWNSQLQLYPFETSEGDPTRAFFFDTGIIVRGLAWLYRETQEERWLDAVRAGAISLERDFRVGPPGVYHPIISLPDKAALPWHPWWSRNPGCFLLKAGLAWLDAADLCGEAGFREHYAALREFSIRHADELLDLETEREKLMDRLHPLGYFLEGLQAEPEPSLAAVLLERGEALLQQLSPQFERSDALAQLLRIRLLLGGAVSDTQLAHLAGFQYESDDAALQGGFAFGRRSGSFTPHCNPVSTAFCLQTLCFAHDAANGQLNNDYRILI